ncbi:MAG: leucine-responsive transcriptional regulator Lrp [Kangiella sp.]|uniref:Leucine-responsive regulatory protein n=1 Tax=Kangiella koreensis (strain DSM 16069 / JCM 12317 / KCTC 12182 / SW-125) TaxID=523791 RepID=C7RB95_KANKD|nr:leucine-responsive transcriptional regulator Lrp [Kangiella koreensis]ACV26537.1 transcriptional regulator, AsnC family [Kangiella koreensis DSM 16069]MCW8855733.1 leucine-responsive transcriptional regulator Lrp [Kangiella sp.]MCW9029128.1 leucine-responsive transcriptional regulator Lrp [Kangiella sp.]
MKVQSDSKQILDRIDLRILNELQQNGRISNVELAKRVGLSATPCLERVKRLETNGFIEGYSAKLNPMKLAASLLVFVEIRLSRTSPDVFEEFKQAVTMLPTILECHLVSGDFDYLLKARVADMKAYRKLLGETLLMLPGVSASRSYMVMEEVKETSLLPINPDKR